MTRRVITNFQRALIPNRYKTTALERVWSERQRGEPWRGGEKRIMTSTLPPYDQIGPECRPPFLVRPLVTVSGRPTGRPAAQRRPVEPLGGAPAVSMRAHGLPLLCLVSEAGRSSLRAKQLLARSSLHARRHAASPPPVCQAAAARSEGSSGRLRPTTPLLPESIAAPAASPAPPAPDAQAGLQPPRSRPRAEGVPFLRLRGAGRAGARPTRRAARGIPASASPSAEAPQRPRARAAGSGPARGGRTAARGAGAAHNPARAPPSSQSAARRGRAPP